jgi:uncharacterized cupredoxin-like copper-binding protein
MTRIFRAPILVLIGLVAIAGLPVMILILNGVGSTSTEAVTQVASPKASTVAIHLATTAPVAVTAAPTAAPAAVTAAPTAAPAAVTAAPAATQVAATAAPATPDPATPAPAPTDAPPPAPVDVSVTLAEFSIQSSLAVFHVGVPYHFIITNNGKIAHELNVANLDARSAAPGATVTLDLTFPNQAQAEFACHLPSHYQAGMKLPVTVEP